jgi:hypothetical protein
MKTVQLPPDCTVQSVTDQTGRRTIKFTRNAPDAGPAQVPAKRRKVPFRLKLSVVPEATFSFEPAVQIRSHAKP